MGVCVVLPICVIVAGGGITNKSTCCRPAAMQHASHAVEFSEPFLYYSGKTVMGFMVQLVCVGSSRLFFSGQVGQFFFIAREIRGRNLDEGLFVVFFLARRMKIIASFLDMRKTWCSLIGDETGLIYALKK